MRAKRLLVLLLFSLVTPGCYLSHLAAGQWRIMHAAEPIDEVLSDPATPPTVRGLLARVEAVREFATRLGLEVDDEFTSYVPWPGDRMVTTVVRTRAGEVTPDPFYFPLIGDVPYKGYFDQARAEAEAEHLRKEGFDVCTVAVRAYSTLGWLADPVTGPMLRGGEGELVETLIHELVHATFYVSGHARFNEGTATFIGQEGCLRFYAEQDEPERVAQERARIQDDRRVRGQLLALREAVESLYASTQPGEERDARRRRLEEEARRRLAELPLTAGDAKALADSVRLNDACLALTGTYEQDLDAYSATLAALGGDLKTFVARARQAAKTPHPREVLLAE